MKGEAGEADAQHAAAIRQVAQALRDNTVVTGLHLPVWLVMCFIVPLTAEVASSFI